MEKTHFLDRREAAAYLSAHGLRTSWRTLQKQATVGGGPPYRLLGSRAVYTPPDLDHHITSKLSELRFSTSGAA
jgi:hypothetical protein